MLGLTTMKLILLPSLQYHLWKMMEERRGIRKPLIMWLGGENAVKSSLSIPRPLMSPIPSCVGKFLLFFLQPVFLSLFLTDNEILPLLYTTMRAGVPVHLHSPVNGLLNAEAWGKDWLCWVLLHQNAWPLLPSGG